MIEIIREENWDDTKEKKLPKDIRQIGRPDVGGIRCIVLTGEGDKSFVAGADIGSMSTMTKAEGEAFGPPCSARRTATTASPPSRRSISFRRSTKKSS